MKIDTFVVSAVQTNCYIVQNEATKECFIVDPGAPLKSLIHFLKENELKVQAVLLTHGHFDHIMGLDSIVDEFSVPVYIYDVENALLMEPTLNLSANRTGAYSFEGAREVTDEQILSIAGFQVQVIHTPGHTAGSCCYYIPDEGVLFSGDTLFKHSIGRTDLPTSDNDQIVPSIQERLFVLPEETKVYPGHASATTIGEEKAHNPYAGLK